ncbi:hypothetical protein BC332_19657 [Capsicum chinense]|nr:hypothetical protein BC332_19657 [Capsicum chinense]
MSLARRHPFKQPRTIPSTSYLPTTSYQTRMEYNKEVQENSAHTEGFRFHPTDRELMKYLILFVISKPFSKLVPIVLEDLYTIGPWDIFKGKKDRALYFFTELKKKRTGNTRYVRSVGEGSWKSQDKGKAVCSEKGSILGYKRSLRYQNPGLPLHDGQWLMKEYSICDDIKKHLRQRFHEYNKEHYVLCRVKRKIGKDEDGIAPKETIIDEEINDIIGSNDAADTLAIDINRPFHG